MTDLEAIGQAILGKTTRDLLAFSFAWKKLNVSDGEVVKLSKTCAEQLEKKFPCW